MRREPGAWELFVERTTPVVLTVVRRILRARGALDTPHDPEDVCENCFLALLGENFKLLRAYDKRYRLSTWVGVIARTETHRFLRRRRLAASIPEDDGRHPPAPDPDSDEFDSDVIEEVRDAWARLPERDRDVLKLYYEGGKSYKEIAGKLGISANTVGSLIFRARERLRGRIRRFLH